MVRKLQNAVARRALGRGNLGDMVFGVRLGSVRGSRDTAVGTKVDLNVVPLHIEAEEAGRRDGPGSLVQRKSVRRLDPDVCSLGPGNKLFQRLIRPT